VSVRSRSAALGVTLFVLAVPPVPIELTAEQDHRRLMDLLHITSLRPGADGRNPQAPNAANYDEAKANPYPDLPDPLVLKSGAKITTAKEWWDRRRPEIVEDFDREVYGRVPKHAPAVRWEVTRAEPQTIAGVPVTTRTLVGHVDASAYPAISVDIEMTLTTPAGAARPVPVMLTFGFNFPAGAGRPGPSPPASEGPTWQEQIVSKSWGYAVLYPNTVQADNGAGLTRGIIGLVNRGQPRPLDDWGALRAWAWGASRALDYFETDKSVDARQVGIEGLSRLREGRPRRHGVRPTVRHRLRRLVRRGRGQAAPPELRRARRERRRHRRVPLDGGQLHQVCGTSDPERPARRCPRAHRALRAASRFHRRRLVRGRRRLGRREGNVSRRGRRGARVPAAGRERHGHDGLPADRDRAASPSASTAAVTRRDRTGRRSCALRTATSNRRRRWR